MSYLMHTVADTKVDHICSCGVRLQQVTTHTKSVTVVTVVTAAGPVMINLMHAGDNY
jgi:hypothetical protein